MELSQAQRTNSGETVIYHGQPHTVASVLLKGVSGPYFRLSGCPTSDKCDGRTLTSYRLVSKTP